MCRPWPQYWMMTRFLSFWAGRRSERRNFWLGPPGKPHRFDSSLDVREVVVNGDWALTRVQLAIELTATRGAKAARFDGVTMSVWRKSATGRWLIWRDSNMVAPVGEAV
jgi:ketosteroid isomerase-like protein